MLYAPFFIKHRLQFTEEMSSFTYIQTESFNLLDIIIILWMKPNPVIVHFTADCFYGTTW